MNDDVVLTADGAEALRRELDDLIRFGVGIARAKRSGLKTAILKRCQLPRC